MTVAVIDILLVVLVCSVLWFQVNQWLAQRSRAEPTALERPPTPRLVAADHAGDTPPLVLTGGPEDPPLLEIVECSPGEERFTGEPVPVTPQLRVGLVPLLQHVPGVFAGVELAHAYVLRFSPDVSRSLVAGGPLRIMESSHGGARAIAVRKVDGTIVEQGSLHSLRYVGAAIAAWQVMAAITGQKFLADINAKLADLKNAFEDVRSWLTETERIAELRAYERYLSTLAVQLHAADLTPGDYGAIANSLETIELSCLKHVEASRALLNRGARQFAVLRLRGKGLKVNSARASQVLQASSGQARVALLALRTEALSVQLRAALPLSRTIALARLRDMVALVSETSDAVAEFESGASLRISELKGRVAFPATNRRYRSELGSQLHVSAESLKAVAAQLQADAERLHEQLSYEIGQAGDSLALRISVRRGEIVAVHRLPPQLPAAAQHADLDSDRQPS